MNSQKRVMLLIDADNVSAGVIEQAIEKVMVEHRAIHVRRAYCTAESALAHAKFFKTHSIRPIVNLSSGKNANDIALAVDAIDLVLAERPDVVVIVSSDSDFAPLVIRLREKGCRVEGIGQQGKTGEDSKPVYDAFTDFVHQKQPPAPAPAPRKRASTARPARKAAAPKPPPAPAAPPLPADVQRILDVLPELGGGSKLELGIAAERLRAEGLLAKNAPSTKLFKKYIDFFVLTPERQPNKVQYQGQPPR